MTDNFQIGTTRLESGFTKSKFFHLQAGDNFYRVLPPMFSLATTGQYAKYYAVHWTFRDTKGNMIPFLCIQEKDNKSKMITIHCPIDDRLEEAKAAYEAAKKRNTPKEKLEEFFNTIVRPLQPDKKFYLNVINLNNEIGVLGIPYKSFNALKAKLAEMMEKGIDPTAKVGYYLNFKKTQAYKGDRDTAYSVELAVESFQDAQGNLLQKPKKHELTPDIINRLPNEARDLTTLYKSLTSEQIAILLQLKGQDQSVAFEKFLGFSEQPEQEQTGSISIPNTNATAPVTATVTGSNIEFSHFGSEVDTPPFDIDVPKPAVQPATVNKPAAQTTQPAPQTAQVPMGNTQQSVNLNNLSNEDFVKFFGNG